MSTLFFIIAVIILFWDAFVATAIGRVRFLPLGAAFIALGLAWPGLILLIRS